MKYLFDMGEVWHIYSDVGNQWIYHRLERVSEEIQDKGGNDLPGPLGKLDVLKQLEGERGHLKRECSELGDQIARLEKERLEILELAAVKQQELQACQEQLKQEQNRILREEQEAEKRLLETQKQAAAQVQKALSEQKESFEKSYTELKATAEELQKEGRMWRQRYLDLAYQVSSKEK